MRDEHELAAALWRDPKRSVALASLQDVRAYVSRALDGAAVTTLDGVTEALWRIVLT